MRTLSDQLQERSNKGFYLTRLITIGNSCVVHIEEETFQPLKQKFCSAHIFTLPEGTKDFII